MKTQNLPRKKVILVTGSSTGFGLLTAQTLARQGHTVYASMRNIEGKNVSVNTKLQQLAKSENLDLAVIELDVTDDISVEKAIAMVLKKTGQIDVLINNAGVMNVGITEAYTIQQAQRQFDVNFFGMLRTTRATLPHMREQKQGLLIQISSLAGRLVFPFFGLYNASKFAVEAVSEAYRYELADFGIDSIIVEPGPYGTNLLESAPRPEDKQRLKQYADIADIPENMLNHFAELNRNDEACDPQEVADAISNLINTPTGQRPLRTVVGIDYGVKALNKATSPFQQNLLETLGMKKMY